MTDRDILTVKQLVNEYPAFTESGVRWWIFNAKHNGFESCMIRIGGRIYVDRQAFQSWIDSHRVMSS